MHIYLKCFRWLFSRASFADTSTFLFLVLGGLCTAALESISILSIIPISSAFLSYDAAGIAGLGGASTFQMPGFIADVINARPIIQTLWYFVAIFVFSTFARLLLIWAQTKFIQTLAHKLSVEILSTYALTNYSIIRSFGESEITALAINKCSDFVNSVLGSLFSVINALFFGIGILVVFALFDLSSFSYLTFMIVSIYAGIFLMSNKILIGYSKKISKLLTKLLNVIFEVLVSRKEIELGYYSDYFVKKFAAADKSIRDMRVNVLILGVAPKYLIEASVVLALALLFQFRDTEKLPALPVLVGMIFALHRVLPLVNTLYAAINNFQATSSILNEVMDFASCHTKERIDNSNKARTWHMLEVENLQFFHKSNKSGLLKPISEKIESGKTYLLRGPSGTGKSTFLDCLSGVQTGFSGTVRLFTGSEGSNEIEALHKHIRISYLTQNTFIHNGTVLDNLLLDLEDYDVSKLQNICNLVGIVGSDSNDIGPNSIALTHQCGERGMFLSGGQRQRVAFARVLMQESSMLLCDEALSAVEHSVEVDILENLKSVCPDVCVLYVSHRVGLERFFDQTIDF